MERQKSVNSDVEKSATSMEQSHFLPIMSATRNSACWRSFFSVSRAISCWLWRGVRKNTVLPFLSAYSRAGESDAAVLPRPVGALAMRWLFCSMAQRTSSINFFCFWSNLKKKKKNVCLGYKKRKRREERGGGKL